MRERGEKIFLQPDSMFRFRAGEALALESLLARRLVQFTFRDVLYRPAQSHYSARFIPDNFTTRRYPDALSIPEGLHIQHIADTRPQDLLRCGSQSQPTLVGVHQSVLILETENGPIGWKPENAKELVGDCGAVVHRIPLPAPD